MLRMTSKSQEYTIFAAGVLLLAASIGIGIPLDIRVIYIVSVPFAFFMIMYGVRDKRIFPVLLILALGLEQLQFGESGGLFTLSKLGGAALFILYLWTHRRSITQTGKASLHVMHQFLLQVLFVLYMALTALWSPNPSAAIVQLSTFILLLFLTWIIANFVSHPKHVTYFTHAFVIYGTVLALFALIEFQNLSYNAISEYQSFRASSISKNPNISAMYMVISFAIVTSLIGHNNSIPMNISFIAILIIITAGILSTASRGGILASIFVLILSLVFTYNRKRSVLTILFTAIIVVVILTRFPDYHRILVARLYGQTSDLTGFRLELIDVAIEYFSERPINGIGLGGFRYYNPAITSKVPHNTYMGLLAETGMIGFILFSSLFIMALRNIYCAWKLCFELHLDVRIQAAMRAILLSLLGMMVLLFFGDGSDDKMLWVLLGLAQMSHFVVNSYRRPTKISQS